MHTHYAKLNTKNILMLCSLEYVIFHLSITLHEQAQVNKQFQWQAQSMEANYNMPENISANGHQQITITVTMTSTTTANIISFIHLVSF